MVRFACLIVALLLCAPLFGQDILVEGSCYTDPVTGRQFCPIQKTVKAAASAVGKTAQAVANAVTPNNVALPMQHRQAYSVLPAAGNCACGPSCNCAQQATVQTFETVQVVQTSTVQAGGWSKSWTIHHGQPLRNLGRRVLGR